MSVTIVAASLVLAGVLGAAPSGATVLENPGPRGLYSGIGVISGWKCEAAGDLTVRFNGGAAVPLAYRNDRPDTQSVCGDTHNGFVAIWNWARLGEGTHEAVAYDNGVEFARSTFTVGTAGEEFLRGVEAGVGVADFPTPGSNGRFVWNESTQHLELAEAGRHVRLVNVRDAGARGGGGEVEQWAQEWVDTCYRKADQLSILTPRASEYQWLVEQCIRRGNEVGGARLWRDRYVRELVQEITEEAESLEAWFLDGRECHPSGDIDPDVYGDEGTGDGLCGLFD